MRKRALPGEDGRKVRSLVTCIAFASSLFLATAASALGPSAAVLVGYAPSDELDDAVAVGYGLGLGARAGFTLPFNIYVGGTLVYHVGDHPGSDQVWTNVWYVGGEAGYDIEAGPVTVRPYVGYGYARRHIEEPQYCDAAGCHGSVLNAGNAALFPGLTVLGNLGNYFAGVDLRYVILFDVFDGNAPGIFLTGGIRF